MASNDDPSGSSHARLEENGTWPRAIVFAIPLKDPLPIPHHSKFLRIYGDNPIPELRGVRLQGTREDSPYPDEFNLSGTRFVSLRIWQLTREADSREAELSRHAINVLRAIGGGPIDDGEIPSLDSKPYLTVVEAITIVRNPDDATATPDRPDPLTRCLSALMEQVRAYRLARNVRISELTYERVFPLVPFIWRELATTTPIGDLHIMVLSHANVITPDPAILTQEDIRAQNQMLVRLIKGDPLLVYAERRLEAQISIYRDGQYAESVIQTAIAAEVLLGGVLGLMLWEESRVDGSVATALEELSQDLSKRVRRCFHNRLGGSWVTTGSGPVAQWQLHVARVRNRVVHRAYRPSAEEAKDALDSLVQLERYICDRLAQNLDKYSRTALLILGRRGLENRNKWDSERFADDVIGAYPDLVAEYVQWRDRVDLLIDAPGG